MQQVRPNFLNFLHDFILLKLAYHLKVDPQSIQVNTFESSVSNFDLVYDGKTYEIKMSNPVFTSKNKTKRIWDFDVRTNLWSGGKNKRLVKDRHTCDYYLLIGMINNVPQKMFTIPAEITPTSHVRISVSGKSKYQQYLI